MHYFKVISLQLCEDTKKQLNPQRSFNLLWGTYSLNCSRAIIHINNGQKIDISKHVQSLSSGLIMGVKQASEMLAFRLLLMWFMGQEGFS